MKTWQDYTSAPDKVEFIKGAINEYRSSEEYMIALDADQYEKQRNSTITTFMRWFYNATGRRVADSTASNNRIASNFFHRLNTARCTYSLGNGVTLSDDDDDAIKATLGDKFDTILYNAGYDALIHGVSYLFYNVDKVHEFKATEFCPLMDEDTGALKAGIRFWSLDWENKPVTAVLYMEDGFIKYRTKAGSKGLDLEEYEKLRPYKYQVVTSQADGEVIVGESNYSALPIVPLYGSKHKQSTLVGLKQAIDSYDLINSGFANDLEDCAEVYWLISDATGTQPQDIQRFREQLKFFHVGIVDSETPVQPFTQQIPYEARTKFLEQIQSQMYRDFAVLDVHTVQAGATNDHIDAAYQPMDEEADDFEYQVIETVQQLLALQGIEGVVPQFKRNRISNQYELTQMIMMAAQYLDSNTLLSKLPFITVDEVQKILEQKDAEADARMDFDTEQPEEEDTEQQEE